MMDEGFSIMDLTITDDMEIMLKGIKEVMEEKKKKEDLQKPDIDWGETI